MAIKYQFTYSDIENTVFTCDISSDTYAGDIITVQGFCVIERPEVKQIYTVIRGGGMRLSLEASMALSFEDLYEDGEKTWQVTLRKEDVVIFYGYIDPAGLFEDMVNDKWIVNLDCADGLALLDALSYVDPDGNPYLGKASDIEVIYNCLARTGLTSSEGAALILETSINTRYNGLSQAGCPLANTKSNQERFYREDGNTPQSCKEVLESILKKYGGVIYMDGLVYKVYSFYELLALDRRFYTYRGVNLISSTISNYPVIAIGSHIAGAYPHWVNENQRKSINPGVGAVRVNYKYGFVGSIISNFNFKHNGSVIEDWTIISNDVELVAGGLGFTFPTVISSTSENPIVESSFSDVVLDQPLQLSMMFDFDTGINHTTPYQYTSIGTRIEVKLIGESGDTYYVDENLEWVSTTPTFIYELVDAGLWRGSMNIDVDLPDLPEGGDVKVTIKDFYLRRPNATVATITMRELKLFPKVDDAIEGETHTVQISGTNTRVDDVIKVTVGDNPSDIYLGTINEADGVTNTNFWRTVYDPSDYVSEEPILEILTKQIALYREYPSYKFSGDVFGFVDYNALFEFDFFPGKLFVIASYEYDTVLNVITAQWLEIRRGDTLGNTYEFNLDYGNVTPPTITSN